MRKKLFGIKAYMPAMLLAYRLGIYLDMYFTGKGMYAFPMRHSQKSLQFIHPCRPLMKIMESLNYREHDFKN